MNIHPNRAHIHKANGAGAKAADVVASFVGSWSFVMLMSILLIAWILWNSTPIFPHFDQPPFILLNLCLSFMAGYTAPFIMMSQNRQAAKDALRDNTEASEVDGLVKEQEALKEINLQQLQILREHKIILDQQSEILELLRGSKPAQVGQKAQPPRKS